MAFKNTAAALRVFGGQLVSRLSQGLEENNSNASGKLNESIEFKVRSQSNKLTMDLSMLDYYDEVDEGTKPKGKLSGSKVSAKGIEDWLRLPVVKDKMENRGFNITDSSIPPLAVNIANRLTKDGRKGNNFYTNVMESTLVTKDLDKRMTEAIGEDIDAAIGSFLDDID